jgi:lysine 6-dehydrogenase
MKIIVMGGAGDMGSKAVEDLVVEKDVERVTIADQNIVRARELAAGLSGRGAEVAAALVSAEDHAGLVAAMRGHDLCASALGPFHRFEEKLVAAAVEALVSYCSICDEWEPADAVMARFGDEARKKGLTILIGLGASPGLTNVAARFLADKLDRVRRLDISIYQPLNAGGGPAVVRHMLHIMSGEIAAFKAGRRVMVKALSETAEAEFPQYGRIRMWNMGHSEPATLPRFMPGLEAVNFFMGFGPGAGLFVKPAQWGLFASPGRAEKIAAALSWLEAKTGGEPGLGAIRVDAYGDKGGKEEHHLICGIGQMREATGVCLSIGALMLGRGQLLIEEGGVYAPEAVIEPNRFLSCLKAKGITAYEDVAMTRPVNVTAA